MTEVSGLSDPYPVVVPSIHNVYLPKGRSSIGIYSNEFSKLFEDCLNYKPGCIMIELFGNMIFKVLLILCTR